MAQPEIDNNSLPSSSRKKYDIPLDSMVSNSNRKIKNNIIPKGKPANFQHYRPDSNNSIPKFTKRDLEILYDAEAKAKGDMTNKTRDIRIDNNIRKGDMVLQEHSRRIISNNRGHWGTQQKGFCKQEMLITDHRSCNKSVASFDQYQNEKSLAHIQVNYKEGCSQFSDKGIIIEIESSEDSDSSSSEDDVTIKQLEILNNIKGRNMMGNSVMPVFAMQPVPVFNPTMFPQGMPYMQLGLNMGCNALMTGGQGQNDAKKLKKAINKLIKTFEAKKKNKGKKRHLH